MYPFPFLNFKRQTLQRGSARQVVVLSDPYSNTGNAGYQTTSKTAALVLTTDNRTFMRGAAGPLPYARYDGWTLLFNNVDSIYSSGSNVALKMLDGTWKRMGNNNAVGSVDANYNWTIPGIDMSKVVKIALDFDTALFLMDDGTLYGGGQNLYGSLGTATGNISTPVQITTGVTDIACSGYYVNYYIKDGVIYAAGNNEKGTLYDGTTTTRKSFAPVNLVSGQTGTMTKIVGGIWGIKAVDSEGRIWAGGSPLNTGIAPTTNFQSFLSPIFTTTDLDILTPRSAANVNLIFDKAAKGYYASNFLGPAVGLTLGTTGGFEGILIGFDHSKTLDIAAYYGGIVFINNSKLYIVGLDRIRSASTATSNIIPSPTELDFIIPGIPDQNKVIFSDSIARSANGYLVGSTSDSYAGGTAKVWQGNANIVTTVADGPLSYAKSPGTTIHSSTVNIGVIDASMSFEVVALPTNTTLGVNATMDFRKAFSDSGNCYRLVMYGDSAGGGFIRLGKRISGVGSFLSDVDIPVQVGQRVKATVKGSTIKIFIDDDLKLTMEDTTVPNGNFFGFSSSASSSTNSYSFRNCIVESI